MHGVGCMTLALGKLTELVMWLRACKIAHYGNFKVYARFRVGFASARQLGEVEKLIDGSAHADLFSLKDFFAKQQDILWIERLLNEVYSSEFHCIDGSAYSSVGSEHDHRHLGSKTS